MTSMSFKEYLAEENKIKFSADEIEKWKAQGEKMGYKVRSNGRNGTAYDGADYMGDFQKGKGGWLRVKEDTSKLSDEEKLKRLIDKHNIVYHYQSGRAYKEGEAQYKEIQALAKKVSKATFKKLWNDAVKRKLASSSQAEFLIK